jgi:hypothetical protein
MPVLGNGAILLARSVSSARVYRDLMAIESTPPVFGIFDQTRDGGIWIETFDRTECVKRLREWPICSGLITSAALLDYTTVFSLNYLRIENPVC